MILMDWFLKALQNYAVFKGRSQRSEYWFFVLFYLLISIVAGILDGMFGTFDENAGFGVFGLLVTLGLLIPSISVGVRRLHDIGRSGWWLLIGIVPLIGWIVLIVFAVMDSAPGENEYGPNPKLVSA